jgi:NAD(P)-dependent dehydrogenase (short-subunit alcohol dehydrogenase family)
MNASQTGPLHGRTALVTGGSRGIGRAVALRLAADGARVAVHYGAGEAAAKETVARIEAAGGRAFTVQASFGTAGPEGAGAAVERLFAALEAELGKDGDAAGLDVLVNNAGVSSACDITQITEAEINRLLAVNVTTPLLVIQAALPLLRDNGRVVNIGSAATRIAVPLQIGYTASKAALEALAPTLAIELGRRGITVNTVAPGVIRTDMTEHFVSTPEASAGLASIAALNRIGAPDDVADIVGFLASPEARFVTGQTVDASGGAWLGPIAPPAV